MFELITNTIKKANESKSKINKFHLKINSLIYDLNKNTDYIDDYMTESLMEELENIIEEVNTLDKHVSGKEHFLMLLLSFFNIRRNLKKCKNNINNLNIKQIIANKNMEFVPMELVKHRSLFEIDKKSLDEDQRIAIVKDEINNLVIAGAGSGKTTTILGKIKYLIKVKNINPQDILVLSFTNKSSADLAERIKSSIGITMDVFTFHKLGLNIIEKVMKQRPLLTTLKMNNFINESIKNFKSTNSDYSAIYQEFILNHFHDYKSKFDFKTKEEYEEHLAIKKLQSLKGERMKSVEEISIANFLYVNGIKYEYETQYPFIKTNYRPDFYLSDYDLYLEHFGVNRKGEVPPFFEGKNGLSAKESYNRGMEWKRKLHSEHNTKLIETYSFEKYENILFTELKKRLAANGVLFKPIPVSQIEHEIISKMKMETSTLINLMVSFIEYMRTNKINFNDIQIKINEIHSPVQKYRTNLFISLVQPLHDAYVSHLKKRNEIDFSDMINQANDYISTNQYRSSYKYIIVDEYQDISLNRLELVKKLRDQNKGKTFCVGDDWQSIYQFAGSKVELFMDFESFMGYTEKSKIGKTYRYDQNLVDISSTFIQKNRSQITKDIISNSGISETKSVEIVKENNLQNLNRSLRELLNLLPTGKTVLLLGRYADDIDRFTGEGISYTFQSGITNFSKRKDLIITYMTVHRSKGLEADYVFILNNENGIKGFPSGIQDDSVFNVLKDNKKEEIEFAEERRLFYVALTRAKEKVWLMASKGKESKFIRELEQDQRVYTFVKESKGTCPTCKNQLVLRKGKFGKFYGCMSYPKCNFTKSFKESLPSKK